jgi:hypothetical protein
MDRDRFDALVSAVLSGIGCAESKRRHLAQRKSHQAGTAGPISKQRRHDRHHDQKVTPAGAELSAQAGPAGRKPGPGKNLDGCDYSEEDLPGRT